MSRGLIITFVVLASSGCFQGHKEGPANVVIQSAPVSAQAGQCSSAVTVAITNWGGNDVGVASATEITLQSSYTGSDFSFYSDSACSQKITSLSLAKGENGGNFYFQANVA